MKNKKTQTPQDVPIKLISLEEAVQISNGYYSSVQAVRNLICRGKVKRYGPPKHAELNYYEFMHYLGRPA